MILDNRDENFIEYVKNASYEDLYDLSDEIRDFLIDAVAKNGGHLASNLGVVELTIALHKVFDTPYDKIIFDVGHQSYVHKILTGRGADFDTLRQLDGLSGFPKRSESVHDMFDSGHSGTSISAAYGYAKSRDLKGENYACIAVIGDGALTGGVAYEALNNIGDSKTKMIVVINDNEMSIDSPHGGMHNHLNSLRTSKKYVKFKKNLRNAVHQDSKVYNLLRGIREDIKDHFLPAESDFFRNLGFKYFGPINGHDIKSMVAAFEVAKDYDRPVVIHVKTQKGKGFKPAEENPSKFHGIGAFDRETVTAETTINENSYSTIFGRKLLELAEKDPRICAVSAAMVESTGLGFMRDKLPERVFDANIAEQHAATFAAGLALNGMKPVLAIYSTFLQRAYDQIVSEIALQNLPVVFAIDRAGITGQDGETHQGMFDTAYMNCIPNMTILAPKDGEDLKAMLEFAFKVKGPVAIRIPRDSDAKLSEKKFNPNVCMGEQLTGDGDVAILAVGSMVKEAMKAHSILKSKGINAVVYNARLIKPLNAAFLEEIENRYTRIITVEDGCLHGGYGEAVNNYFSESFISVKCIAWPDKYIEHGKISELRSRYGMDAEGIAKTVEVFIEN